MSKRGPRRQNQGPTPQETLTFLMLLGAQATPVEAAVGGQQYNAQTPQYQREQAQRQQPPVQNRPKDKPRTRQHQPKKR